MPSMASVREWNGIGRYAQRVVYPNGTRSDPFVVPLSKAMMLRFAGHVIEGYWPRPADQFPEHEREALGTCRIEGTFKGQFRRTLETWGAHHCSGTGATMRCVHRTKRLSYGDVLIAFLELGAGGACFTYNATRSPDGDDDICIALAKTTIEWAKFIEEW